MLRQCWIDAKLQRAAALKVAGEVRGCTAVRLSHIHPLGPAAATSASQRRQGDPEGVLLCSVEFGTKRSRWMAREIKRNHRSRKKESEEGQRNAKERRERWKYGW